ncbi:unnamed protein product [Urochloa humidicola]
MLLLKELMLMLLYVKLWQLLSESGRGPDNLFLDMYKLASFVRAPTSDGREPTKSLPDKSKMYDRDDRLKICIGNGPLNLLF